MINRMYEYELWDQGIHHIACCDEVGRGCLFGPVVAAAVILKPHDMIQGVRDSKKVSAVMRERLYDIIFQQSIAVGIGIVSVKEIELLNIKEASRKAMKDAIHNLKDTNKNPILPEAVLCDAETLDIPYPQQAVIHGEDHVHGIAAASIIAKVTRDRLCQEWHKQYPEYGIDRNKGYGTREHREALQSYGPTPFHRKTFLRKILQNK